MLRILFFFIRGGGKLLEITIRLLPLGNQQERMLFDRFIITAKSTRKDHSADRWDCRGSGRVGLLDRRIEGAHAVGPDHGRTAIVPFVF
jgi:hypothetical protein